MTRTVPVEFGDRWFWAYDVSLGVLLLEAIRLAAETPPERRPAGADAVLDDFRAQVELGGNLAFVLDQATWDRQQRRYAQELIEEAGRRLRERGTITRAEASRRYLVGGEPYHLRHQERIDGNLVADLAEAIGRLVHGELQPPAESGRHWFFGAEGGPRTL